MLASDLIAGPGRFRSLYWKIMLGLTLLIALLVLAQAGAVLWLISRGERGADRLESITQGAGWRLGEELAANPQLDLDRFIREVSPGDRLFAITADGRVAGADPGAALARMVVDDLQRNVRNVPADTWARGPYRAAPVFVRDRIVAVVGVVPPTLLERYGPAVALVAVVVMLGGGILGTGFIIGPLRARLRNVTETARRLGGGDFAARATQDGSDEVTELATAFNVMADELVARTNRLEMSDSARRQLLADVSHELMTPVTTIRGYLETLAMPEVQLDTQTRLRYIAVARRETHRLERLIGDLLDSARLEAGAAEMDPHDVPVADLFDRIVARYEHECRMNHVRLMSSVAPGAELVFADAFRLEQALTNITANALRHTREGGRIVLQAEPGDSSIVLSVIDDGEGIAPEHLPLIFDRFYKASSSWKGTSTGSGLGLYIVKTIATRHGGEVSATSQVGSGTTIRLELPRHEDHAPADSRSDDVGLPTRDSAA